MKLPQIEALLAEQLDISLIFAEQRRSPPPSHPFQAIQGQAENQKILLCWEQRKKLIPEDIVDATLKEWLKILLLGACVGFAERGLRSDDPGHQYIYPRMMEDVTQMYLKLQRQEVACHELALLWEVYDFGVQWVYYLDWKLYMSHEALY